MGSVHDALIRCSSSIHGLMLRNAQQHCNVLASVYLHDTRVCQCVCPRSRFIARMQAEVHLHENKSRTEACLRLHSDCRSRMAFLVPATVVTQATVLCNKEPTLYECGASRTACLPACPPVRGVDTPNGNRIICS